METCGQCGARATCAYSWGLAEQYACASHDPTQVRGGFAVRGPLTYRTIPPMQVIYLGTAANPGPAPGGTAGVS